MDANKLKVLQDIKYEIRPTCGNCKFGIFFGTSWGTCKKYRYDHLKHVDSTRDLSINKNGYCAGHEWDPGIRTGLGAYEEFVK